MKFLVSKDLHSNPNFRLLLGFYALFMALYIVGDLFYLTNFFGANIQDILATLKGNEEEFIEPLSLISLLEHLHISLFLSILALFTTMAIVLRLHLSTKHKQYIIIISMLSLFLSFVSLILTYTFFEFFVYALVGFELLWHFSGLYALLLILKQVVFK